MLKYRGFCCPPYLSNFIYIETYFINYPSPKVSLFPSARNENILFMKIWCVYSLLLILCTSQKKKQKYYFTFIITYSDLQPDLNLRAQSDIPDVTTKSTSPRFS